MLMTISQFSQDFPISETSKPNNDKTHHKPTMTSYKDNLIQKIGGDSQYDFVLLRYCESIQNDPRALYFFANLSLPELIELQKKLLDAAFLDLPPAEAEAMMGRMSLKCHMLWRMGLNERYFEVMKAHFLEALRDCWVEENIVQLCATHYDGLRPMFKQNGVVLLDDEINEYVSTGKFEITLQIPVRDGIKQI